MFIFGWLLGTVGMAYSLWETLCPVVDELNMKEEVLSGPKKHYSKAPLALAALIVSFFLWIPLVIFYAYDAKNFKDGCKDEYRKTQEQLRKR